MNNKLKNDSKTLSIIIPAFNEEVYIDKCLRTLNSIDRYGLDIEILVIDNGSEDNTIQVSEHHGANIFVKKSGTIASLRNYGANHSNGNYLAFLDADCLPEKDWLSKSIPLLECDHRLVLGFRLSIPDKSNWVAKCWDLFFIKRYFTSEVDWIQSGNMIMCRDTFMATNGFDESLTTNEDYDFCYRLKEAGYRIISSSETSVIHLRPPSSLTQIFRKELWHGRDVLKVFIDDIKSDKNIPIFKRKNFFPVVYAIFNLVCLVCILASCLYAIIDHNVCPLLIFLFIPVFVSFGLGLRKITYSKDFKMLSGMTIIYLIYGFARGLTLLPLLTSNR